MATQRDIENTERRDSACRNNRSKWIEEEEQGQTSGTLGQTQATLCTRGLRSATENGLIWGCRLTSRGETLLAFLEPKVEENGLPPSERVLQQKVEVTKLQSARREWNQKRFAAQTVESGAEAML